MMNVVLLTYDFSTKIMGGSVRLIKMAEHLPGCGWKPHVLTASPPEEHPHLAEGHITFIPSPEREFGGGIRVAEAGPSVIGGQNPGWLSRLAFLKRFFPLERQVTWWPSFRKESLKALRGKEIHAVVSTSAPYTMMLFGHWLARKLGVPHLVDVRDDWQARHLFEGRSWLNRTLLNACCRYVVRRAAAVTVVSWRSLLLQEHLGVPVHVLPNGYDEADFAQVPLEAAPVSPEGPLRIVHLGWLGDFRSIGPVLEGLRELRARDLDLSRKVRLEQYGLIEPGQLRLIEAAGLGEMVRVHPQVPHREAVAEMARADVLLVIPGTNIPAALTGKIFEYLRARRPILLWTGEGAALDLAQEVGVRWCIREGDQAALTATLAELLHLKARGGLQTSTDAEKIARFAREATTRQLAGLLDQATGRVARPSTPVSSILPVEEVCT
jgi:hypothetical protein